MDVTLREMRWAILVAQHRSLRQAAEALRVRQSTLSRHLRDLEHQLGAVLFERTNGGTRPTVEGQEFLEVARRIIEETENLATRLGRRSRGETGRLAIGVQASLSAGNLRATLIDQHRRFPEVRTRLVDGSIDHLVSDLASSAIDVAFVIDNRRWNGKSLSVWSERLIVAFPVDHPLVGQELVHWHDLRNEVVLLPQRGPGPDFLRLLARHFGRLDACDLQQHDVSLDRLMTLVGAGLGILLALEGATGASYPGVAYRELHDDGGPTRLGFHAIWRHENGNPSLRRFLDMLRERYPDFSAEPSQP